MVETQKIDKGDSDSFNNIFNKFSFLDSDELRIKELLTSILIIQILHDQGLF